MGVVQLDLVDFLGLIIMWGCTSGVFLLWSYRTIRVKRVLGKLMAYLHKVATTIVASNRIFRNINGAIEAKALDFAHEGEHGRKASQVEEEIYHFGKDACKYEVDNESSMLREMLRRTLLLKKQLDKLEVADTETNNIKHGELLNGNADNSAEHAVNNTLVIGPV